MTGASAQRRIAEFVAGAPRDWAFDAAGPIVRQALLDTLAVAAAGAREAVSRRAAGYAAASGDGPAQRWFARGRCSMDAAALADATMAHALDYDDVTPDWRGHPSAVMFPALTALAASCDATGEDVLRAYVVGFEAGARAAFLDAR